MGMKASPTSPQLLANNPNLGVGVNAEVPGAGVGAVSNDPQPDATGCYFKFKQLDTGDVRYAGAGTGEMCETLRGDYEADANTEVQSTCFCNKPGSPGTPGTSKPPPTSSGHRPQIVDLTWAFVFACL